MLFFSLENSRSLHSAFASSSDKILMTSQTKMIFLTSDENLAREIASKDLPNTRVIDLDDQIAVAQLSDIVCISYIHSND